jgi:hypothetical protein
MLKGNKGGEVILDERWIKRVLRGPNKNLQKSFKNGEKCKKNPDDMAIKKNINLL